MIYAEKVFLGEVAFIELFLDGFVVLHHRNLREHYLAFVRTESLLGVDVK